MRSRCGSAALMVALVVAGVPGAWGAEDVVLRGAGTEFAISASNGSLQAGRYGGREVLGACEDAYWWVTDEGKTECGEAGDVVLSSEVSAERASFSCSVPELGLTVRKDYWLMAGGKALAKRVTVPRLERKGILRVRSATRLAEGFAAGAELLCAVAVVGRAARGRTCSGCGRRRSSGRRWCRARAGTTGWWWGCGTAWRWGTTGWRFVGDTCRRRR